MYNGNVNHKNELVSFGCMLCVGRLSWVWLKKAHVCVMAIIYLKIRWQTMPHHSDDMCTRGDCSVATWGGCLYRTF